MRKQQLQYFISAARNLSFTKAAQENFTVQSAISQQIQQLEKEIGFNLFQRDGRKLSLTAAGEQYYQDTVALLRTMEENQQRAMKIANGNSGELKIGICGSNQIAFMQSLQRFHRDNADISINFVEVEAEEQVIALREHKFDLMHTAIFNMHGAESEIAFAEQIPYELSVFMNDEHPLAAYQNIRLEDLLDYPNIFAALPNNAEGNDTSSTLFSDNGLTPRSVIYTANQDMSTLYLEFNRNVQVAPSQLIWGMPRTIVSRPLENGRYTVELGWAYLKSNQNPALIRLISYLDGLHHKK